MKSYSKVATLIPAYNEEKNIKKVISLTKKYLKSSKILVIDDGSSDNTASIAKKSGAIVIKHKKNIGKGEGLKTGFNYIRKNMKNIDYVIILDADMQFHPKEAKKVIQPLINNEADFIMGKRDWSIVPFKHKLGNLVWRTTFNILFKQNMKDTNCGFIAINRKSLKKMKNVGGGYTIDNSLLISCVKNNLKIAQVPVKVYYKHTSKIPRGVKVVFLVWLFLIKKGIEYRLK